VINKHWLLVSVCGVWLNQAKSVKNSDCSAPEDERNRASKTCGKRKRGDQSKENSPDYESYKAYLEAAPKSARGNWLWRAPLVGL
jgi:hypothetical protein